MNRSKRLGILAGALLVACAATYGVLRYEEHKEQIKNSDAVILEVPVDTVQSLSWEYQSESLSFHREGELWRYDGDGAFPVDEEKIDERLELFQEFGVSFIIEDVEDYGQYGLDKPVCTISLATEETSYEVLLGNYSNMDSERYVSIGDGNVYLVKTDPLDYFDAVLSDMIDHDETPYFDNVTSIQFSGSVDYSILYEENSAHTYCDHDVYFAHQAGGSLPLDTAGVENYLQAISNLNPTDYVTYNATEKELKTYGLDQPELTVTVDYTVENDGEKSAETFILNISRDPEERKATEEDAGSETDSTDEEITAYVRVGESQIIYEISSSNYKKLMAASYDDLRHREVLSADFADILQVDISLEGKEYSITSDGKEDDRTYFYQEEELEIGDFQRALTSLEADSFTDEQPSQKKEISLAVHLDNENYPEVRIELYRYDGAHCLAVVDGEPVSLVARSGVVDLIEAVNAIVLN